MRDNLAAFVSGLDSCGAGAVSFARGQVISPKTTRSFDEVVKAAYANRIQLWSDGFYRTPKIHYDKVTLTGRPFYYFSYGAACSEVAIDTLTGESRVLKVDILHDVGTPINPAIDIGQIEGGFIQGVGWLTTEQLVWNDKGYLSTHAPSTYKIPATGDVPEHFKIELWPEPNREDNVFGSKAVGEPPFMLAISVWEALRDAVAAVTQGGRADGCAGDGGERAQGAEVVGTPPPFPLDLGGQGRRPGWVVLRSRSRATAWARMRHCVTPLYHACSGATANGPAPDPPRPPTFNEEVGARRGWSPRSGCFLRARPRHLKAWGWGGRAQGHSRLLQRLRTHQGVDAVMLAYPGSRPRA